MRLRRPDHLPHGEREGFDCYWKQTRSLVTFIHVLVVIGVVLIAGVSFSQCAKGNGDAHRDALQWASQISDATQVTCTERDTDGDGYISCTVFRREMDPIFIECATGVAWTSGCRAPKAVIRTHQ